MTKNLEKGQRASHNPKLRIEAAASPRRIIVFQPSADLKQRINGPDPVAAFDE